ncbi:MAG: isoprenyl transferase [Alphaproteobacteria bacterium]|jgi:undecaprenyl diphosphate synthase
MEAAASYAAKPAPPVHVAIIMDGNGRWAKARGLPRIAGHQQGAEVVRQTVKHCRQIGVSYLTIYAFSSENWKRPLREIDDLMGLLRLYLRRELEELAREGVRMRFIGDRDGLPDDIIDLVDEAERRTGDNAGFTFIVALNYGARREIAQAARRLAAEAAGGRIAPEDVDEALFSKCLDTTGVPDPDLLIRTSGEQRLSNFLLWQLAYTELVFTPVMWPEFSKDHLEDAINEFHHRERRYGASSG